MKPFKSRHSVLLGSFLWGIIIGCFLVTVDFKNLYSGITVMWALILIFTGTIWFGLKYNIQENILIIKIGFLQLLSIDIGEIKSINRSFNPISSPAASLKRLKIDFKGGEVLISPKSEREFIEHLKSINPDIYINVPTSAEKSSLLTRFVYSLL